MIQYWMKDQVAAIFPGVPLSVDYMDVLPTFMAVYYEGGGSLDPYDFKWRDQRYMVWIESEDWGFAQYMAREVFNLFHEYAERPEIEFDYLDKQNNVLGTDTVLIHKLTAVGEPNPLGINDGRQRYSVNFDAKLITKKEE